MQQHLRIVWRTCATKCNEIKGATMRIKQAIAKNAIEESVLGWGTGLDGSMTMLSSCEMGLKYIPCTLGLCHAAILLKCHRQRWRRSVLREEEQQSGFQVHVCVGRYDILNCMLVSVTSKSGQLPAYTLSSTHSDSQRNPSLSLQSFHMARMRSSASSLAIRLLLVSNHIWL